MQTESLWYVDEGVVECRAGPSPTPGPNDVPIRALYSGISRGTERLILNSRVPVSEYRRMRCPHQEGDFPFPVKYGYALAGVIEHGPRAGEHVFALHPHQRLACVASADAHRIPSGIPPRRAVLAANMETALNTVWDAELSPGSKLLIIGGGVLGLLIAAVAVKSTNVSVADIDPSRGALVQQIGARFCAPETAPRDQDVVIHTSATETGLRLALHCAGIEGKIVEASWYGDKLVSLPLGESFHSRRLKLISSQVGMVATAKRASVSHRQRLALALEHLRDDALDALIGAEIPFGEAPARLPALLNGPGLMTVLRY